MKFIKSTKNEKLENEQDIQMDHTEISIDSNSSDSLSEYETANEDSNHSSYETQYKE